MPDLTEQLSAILSDPAGMERLRNMAAGLLSQNADPVPPPEKNDDAGMPDPTKLMSLVGALKNQGDDDRIRLLYALRPHLSAEKQLRVDKAAKMLKLLSLAPLLRQMGLFEL